MSTSKQALYVAFELSALKWDLLFGSGTKTRRIALDAGDLQGLLAAVAAAREKLGVTRNAPVFSCYEAGRDGFWLHRWLGEQGVNNRVVDPSAIEVSRRAKHVKTDRVDAKKLLSMLIRDVGGEPDVWRTCRVPSIAEEDDRQPQREIEALQEDRTRVSNQIRSLLVRFGIRLKPGHLPDHPERRRQADGQGLPPRTREQLVRAMAHYELLSSQIREVESRRVDRMREALQTAQKPDSDAPGQELDKEAVRQQRVAKQVLTLMTLQGIGITSAWTFSTEFFAWRRFRNRRQVGAAAGLDGTPFDSGESKNEQGISKAGNRRVRRMAVEIAWGWVRYQPDSALTRWFLKRVADGSSKKKAITAMARRLVIALWRWLEQGIVPEGAELKELVALR